MCEPLHTGVDLEMAVMQQELAAGREECADLRAKVYLLEKEKAAQELALGDRYSATLSMAHLVMLTF